MGTRGQSAWEAQLLLLAFPTGSSHKVMTASYRKFGSAPHCLWATGNDGVVSGLSSVGAGSGVER